MKSVCWGHNGSKTWISLTIWHRGVIQNMSRSALPVPTAWLYDLKGNMTITLLCVVSMLSIRTGVKSHELLWRAHCCVCPSRLSQLPGVDAVFYLFTVCCLRSQGRAVWSACFLKAHLCFTSWLAVRLHLDYVRGYIVWLHRQELGMSWDDTVLRAFICSYVGKSVLGL